MMSSQLVFVLMSCSFFVMGVGIFLYVRSRRLLRGVSARSLTALDLAVTSLQSQFDSLVEAHKRLNSRYAMRELRARRAEEPREENQHANGADREKLREIARARGLMR